MTSSCCVPPLVEQPTNFYLILKIFNLNFASQYKNCSWEQGKEVWKNQKNTANLQVAMKNQQKSLLAAKLFSYDALISSIWSAVDWNYCLGKT